MTTDVERELQACTPTPGGPVIRLVGWQTADGWMEAVEIVAHGREATITEGQGFGPTQVYNQLVDPFTDADGRPLHGPDQ